MVEFGNNSLDLDKECDVLHGVLEFSVDDGLEEGESAEDWDIGDAQCLGPIPYDVLMEPPVTSNEQLVASISGAPEQKQLPKHRKLARVQEFVSFHTQSPVSVLESSESDNDIPVRSRSKRLIDLGINPELSTSKQTSNARRRKECRKRLPVDLDPMRSSPKNAHSSLHVSDPAYKVASKPCLPIVKNCVHCQSSNTPLWRDGPLGRKTLCNACGIQYKSGRLFPEYRPLSSPTFVPSQHSNSHKKVAEMRSQAKQLKVEIMVMPLSSKKAANNEDPSIAPLVEANFSELPSPELEIDGTPKQTQLHVDNTSSHVSLMESSHSYLKYRSKYIHCAGAEPWITQSPSGEKTSGEETSLEMHLENDDKSLHDTDHTLLQKGSNSCPPLAKKKKKCAHCQSTMTPLWREGPLGSQTLCNACGLQYGAGRLDPEYRPKASPTFIPSQHSNDNRNIVKMRANHLNDSLTAGIKRTKNLQTVGAFEQRQLPPYTDKSNLLISPQTAGAPEQKHVERMQLPKHVETSTHISLLESSPTYRKFRLKYFEHACDEKSFEMHVENNDKSLDRSDCVSLQNGNKCAHCQTTKSPQGRQGPLGPRTLCSACGQKFQTGCVVPEYRPAASPTFVPSEVSSDRKKIVKMAQSTTGIENKRCAHCESTKTPMWRRGLLGPSALCNACGKQFKVGRLVP